MTGQVAIECLLWLGGLAIALAASELMVHFLGQLGARIHIAAGLLGVLVALGADAPEVTSAVAALHAGSTDVGIGVVLGSNIYNLAGLLGFSALLVGSLSTGRGWMTSDMAFNAAITLLMLLALEISSLRVVASAFACLSFLLFAIGVTRGTPSAWFGPDESDRSEHADPEPIPEGGMRSTSVLVGVLLVAVLCIVAGSDLLVQMSLRLGPTFGIPTAVVGTFVLAIATSLPNTWAAISLSRRGHAAAAITATFSSNSINLVAAIAIPALFIDLHASAATRGVEALWLAGMTLAAAALLALRHSLSRKDGILLLVLYALFVVSRLALA